MKRRALTVLADIETTRLDSLRRVLADVDARLVNHDFAAFAELDMLHFASFVIVEMENAGPCLVFEANFDGDTDEFIARLSASQDRRDELGNVFRHCVGYPDSNDHLGSFLSDRNVGADCYYVGCPGRSARQIEQEAKLRADVRRRIDDLPLRRGGADPAPAAIHAAIRRDVGDSGLALRQRPFLVRHGRRLVLAAGRTLRRLFRAYLAVVAVLLFAVIALAVVFGLLAAADLALALLRFDIGGGAAVVGGALASTARWAAWLILPALAIGGAIALLLAAIRRRERNDREFDAAWDSSNRNRILDRELGRDGIQNHFCSVTKVKPGRFRYLTLRTVLHVIGLAGKVYWNRGKLGEIATIHFARWVIVRRGQEHWLMFLTNYDGSWDSYLSDFIDQASTGVTAVWSNSQGFPRSKFLVLEGSRDEQRFKNFARNSQFPTCAWYRAYPVETVHNIDDNTRQREALFAEPGTADLDAWLRLL